MSKPRKVKPRLSDLVKAARNAGAHVEVSLKPRQKPYWQVSYLNPNGQISSLSVTSELGVVQMVERLLDSETITISVMRGQIESNPYPPNPAYQWPFRL